MPNTNPLAYFITWTVYGTFLQGDDRGWRRSGKGIQYPEPQLMKWRREKLKHIVILLDSEQRVTVETEIERLAEFRNWHLWARNARTDHVHVIVTSDDLNGSQIRDQLKANCTRILREHWPCFRDRPVWTKGGDWRCLNSEDGIEQTVIYVNEAQDRKGRD